MKNREIPVFQTLMPLVLASASPRRHALLAELGLDFTIRVVEGAEPAHGPDDAPETYVMHAAEAKAIAVARELKQESAPASVVLGADTVVVLHESGGPVILGKPANNEEALAMLLHLSGRKHTVYTGCCLLLPTSGETLSDCFYDSTSVHFAPWSEEVLRAYVTTGESFDKAGAYAIQGKGAFLSDRIDGLWSTIVGLPVSLLATRLLQHGIIRPFAA